MAKIPAPNQSDYPPLPDMEPVAVTITEFDGPHTETFTFEGKEVTKVCYHAVYTATAPDLSAARVWADLTRSWHEKAGNGTAGLRNLVNALHPKDLTQEQILEFDPDEFDFVGRKVVVLGTVNDRGRLKVIAYKRSKAAKDIIAPAPAKVAAETADAVLAV